MKTISSYLMISLALLGAVACNNSGFKRTQSGLRYKIFSDGKGPVAKKDEFVKMEILQKVRDSVFMSTYGSVPYYLRVDSPRPIYSPTEILTLMRKGDSAITVLSGDTIRRHNGGQLPAFMKKKDNITITMKILDIFPTQDLLMADRKTELDKQKDKEIRDVEKYLADSNIHATKTELGTYVVVKDPGNGPRVDSGKEVFIRFTGKLMPSGKVFQSNMTAPANEPLKFVIGQHAVIQGWDDGLKLFHEGGKGTLYIPAFLAYDQQPGPGHTPFENLIFDIAVDSVRDAPPAPKPRPGMPTAPNFPRGPIPMRPGARPAVPVPAPRH
ncbi:MAG TPA: FKBP-type peptidyl-prolyl cis-trans isomerase [Puia sp.]|nr:FKBP-type peptidyl-prolyl cis-trans isomerase [Puia sp.]